MFRIVYTRINCSSKGGIVGNHNRFVEEMLAMIPPGTVTEQLEAFHIESITVTRFDDIPGETPWEVSWRPGASIALGTPPLHIVLAAHETLEEWIVGVGHELAHVFSLVRGVSEDLQDVLSGMFGEEYRECERVCDAFSYAWLRERRNYPELLDLLQKEFVIGCRRVIYITRHT
tara:strand:- start:31458 stop:31979 length:522 start_codon:yes stop_codon:yes gene_type:complete